MSTIYQEYKENRKLYREFRHSKNSINITNGKKEALSNELKRNLNNNNFTDQGIFIFTEKKTSL
jgi:hypothetical protein